jgi:pyrroline-5-carboxylate reductase
MSYKIGFIGAGNMGGCLISAVSKVLSQNDICFYDKNMDICKSLTTNTGVSLEKNSVVAKSEFVVLGVKPQIYKNVLEEIKSEFDINNLKAIISIAAGIEIKTICNMLNCNLPVIRIMPNMACSTGEGIVLYSVNELVTPEAEREFLNIFSRAGLIDKIDEAFMDSACAISGCGPAFAYMFIESLADGAVSCGLPRDKAIKYASQMLVGAGKTVLAGGHPDQLKDMVCSPGGSTIQGVLTLDNGAFRGVVSDAVIASYNKNKELGGK